ncbi:MAG: hypothetical protein ACLTGB_10710 [Blautia caecimuris]
MQEEMRKNTLESLVENEKKGTIYAKITKSHPYNTIHGGYFDYSLWIGKILDCKATKEFGDSDTTIETLETAIQYFHYGDQITIVSFEKLVDKVQDFRVFPGKGECLQVSHLYVLDVLELKEKSTVDYIMEHINPEYWKTTGLGCSTYHIRQKGLEEIADYYEACVRKCISQESDNIIEEEVMKTQEMKSSGIPRKRKLKESVKCIVKRIKNIKG